MERFVDADTFTGKESHVIWLSKEEEKDDNT